MNQKMDPERWKLVDQLMDAAFDLPPDQIPQFLNDACGGDESLRKEIERCLAIDRKARSFIEAPVLDEATKTSNPENIISTLRGKNVPQSPFDERKRIADRYELIKKLGKGGMAEVWHAFDVRLHVDVALKSIHLGLRENPAVVEHLRREVRIAREVISPNVCRVFDLVIVDENLELISMEYIDGITLFDLLSESGPLDLRKAMDIAAQFLAGLEAIHEAGLVHRDLKPQNIMITRTGRVVVMDFGISQKIVQMSGTIAGTLPYMSPEQLSGTQVDERSDIFAAGIVLAEMLHTKGAHTDKTREAIWHAVRVDATRIQESPWKSVITRAVALNRENRYSNAGALMRALEEVTQQVEGIDERGPYPGLASFSSSDTEYFFGRELEVETVIKKMEHSRILAIIGPSGAGKTSFLRAGLVPALPQEWCCILTSPGDNPVTNLAQSLVRSIGGLSKFENAEDAVGTFQRLQKTYQETVLIIDRFEELFTLNSSEIQSQYAEMIGRLLLEANVRVILAMRDDFLILCKHHDSLSSIFSEITPLLPLTGASLRRALVQPALKCGYRFEDESMVDLILSDVANERGALPLLAFAAARLWEKRDRKNGLLTRNAYREIGGISGALAQYAEKILDQMNETQQMIVRELFRNLVTSQNTRAARDWDDLLFVFTDRTAAEEVLRILIDARLLTSFEAPVSDVGGNKRRVEIVHESLLSAWPRLIRWQTQDAESAQMRDQLRQASQLWEQRNRSDAFLWTDDAYIGYQTWRNRYTGKLTALEEAFAEAMTHRAGRKRKQRQFILVTAFLILVAVLATITMLWQKASVARDEAVAGSRRAESGRILAIARSLSLDPSTKLAYALRSLEFADNPQARLFAMQAISEGPIYHNTGNGVIAPVMSPDGKWIAGSLDGGGLILIPQDGSAPVTVNPLDTQSNHHIPWYSQFSPDSDLLLYTWRKKMSVVKVWSISKKKEVRSFTFEGITTCFVRNGKAFFISDDSGRLTSPLAWGSSIVRVWNFGPTDPVILGHFDLNAAGWKSFDVDFQSRWIAYAKEEAVYLEDLQKLGKAPARLIGKHAAKTHVVRFNPNGNEIGSSDVVGEIRLWSTDFTLNRKEPLRIFAGNGQPLFNFWFDPDGTSLMAPRDGKTLRWDLNAPVDVQPSVFHEYGVHGAFDSKHRWLTMPAGFGLAVYDYTPLPFYEFRGLVPSQGSSSVRFTPDGKSFISGYTEDGISIHQMPGERHTAARRIWLSSNWSAGSLDVDPLGRYIAAEAANEIYLISIDGTSDTKLKSQKAQSAFYFVAFSPDGKSLAAASQGFIEIWDLASGNSRILQSSSTARISRLVFSHDGTLFSGDGDGNIKRWNLMDGTETKIGTSPDPRYVSGLTISNGGRLLAACIWSGESSQLALYDLRNAKSLSITSHGNRVSAVAFDPTATKLITGDADGIIRVGPVTGEAPLLLYGHKSSIVDVTVHSSGKWILSGEESNPVVRLWRMPEGGTPMQVLNHTEFQNAIRKLTNVRVVEDQTLPAGYRTELEPFQGWGIKESHVSTKK